MKTDSERTETPAVAVQRVVRTRKETTMFECPCGHKSLVGFVCLKCGCESEPPNHVKRKIGRLLSNAKSPNDRLEPPSVNDDGSQTKETND